MTSIRDTYPDLLDPQTSETQQRMIAVLDRVHTNASLPSAADAAILDALRRHPAVPGRQDQRPRLRRALGALVPTSCLLLGIGVLASLRASPPAPVSAEAVLQRAAAVELTPNRTLHLVYRERYYQGTSPHALAGMNGRLTIWVQFDAHGGSIREADTTVESDQGVTTSIDRCVWRRGVGHCYRYEPASLILHRPFTITAAQAARNAGPLRDSNGLTGAGVARLITSLMRHTRAGIRLMPERRLNGVLVYPIRVRMEGHGPGSRPQTLIYYFDAHTYILRGVVALPPSGPGYADLVEPHIMLVKRESVSLAAVPAGTFKLNPPTGKRVLVVLP